MNSKKNTRCFIIEDSKHDLTTIEQYGTIVYVFERGGARPPIWSDAFKEEIVARLKHYDFDPELDYFACVGRQVPVIMAVATIMEQWGGFRALFFYAPESSYVPHELGNVYEEDENRTA